MIKVVYNFVYTFKLYIPIIQIDLTFFKAFKKISDLVMQKFLNTFLKFVTTANVSGNLI